MKHEEKVYSTQDTSYISHQNFQSTTYISFARPTHLKPNFRNYEKKNRPITEPTPN
ncbi:hypothetical protein Hanom_Chr04g00353981 [Helianthus anomalus]